MKILLMIPINRTYVIMPSLGLGYLASVLRKKGNEVKILHCIKEKFDFKDFENYIRKNKYDVIGIQMFTYDLKSVKKHTKIIKGISPGTITIVGGAHPSGDPKGVLKELENVDYAFRGEAEAGFPKLIDVISKKKKINKNIPNLIWRDKDEIAMNDMVFIDNIAELPFPAWDLMNPNEYPEAPHGAFLKNFPYAPLMITRGCPFQCTFCAGKSITGHKIRKRNIANVIEEIEFLMKDYGVKEFLIEDENISLHKELLKEFCETLIKKNLKISWSCPSGLRLDTLDREMLILMNKSGCYSVSVGVEFGSQRIHDLTKKQLTLNIIKEKIALFKNTGIKTTGFFMFGIPGETKKEIEATVRFAKKLAIDRAQFNNFMPLPGSEIYNKLKEEGKLKMTGTEHFFVHDVAYVPEGMTKEELKKIQRKAYLSFYLRPKIILGLLGEIRSFKHLKFLTLRFMDTLK